MSTMICPEILSNIHGSSISNGEWHAMTQKENFIISPTFQFAVDIIEFFDNSSSQGKFVAVNHLLKAGTCIGANTNTSQNAISRANFFHKIKLALKETDDTIYRLNICRAAPAYPHSDNLIDHTMTIKTVLSKIFSSSKKSRSSY